MYFSSKNQWVFSEISPKNTWPWKITFVCRDLFLSMKFQWNFIHVARAMQGPIFISEISMKFHQKINQKWNYSGGISAGFRVGHTDVLKSYTTSWTVMGCQSLYTARQDSFNQPNKQFTHPGWHIALSPRLPGPVPPGLSGAEKRWTAIRLRKRTAGSEEATVARVNWMIFQWNFSEFSMIFQWVFR